MQRAVAKRTISIWKVVVEEHDFNMGVVLKRAVSIRRIAVKEHGFNTEGGGREGGSNMEGGGGEDGSNTKGGGGSNSDLLTSEISSTIVLNALIKKGKSGGSVLFSYIYICQRYSQQPFESTFHCCCETWLCSQALKVAGYSLLSNIHEKYCLPFLCAESRHACI